ncbi:MAG: SpoIIE family protein phosphatase [Thermoleophilaceae bacterium]|nr:SpoIIE family protein phosphatase [Thermoleophilaceae bacterium]
MTALPELFDLRVKARSLAYLFTAGAGLGIVTLAFPHDEAVRDLQLVVLAGIAVAIAAAVYFEAERIRAWQLHVALALGTLILTFANYYLGATSLYPLLYTWTALYAFYFFPLGIALGHAGFIGVCYAALLVIQGPGSPVVRWLLAVGTPVVAGLLISRLLERVGMQTAHADQRERALRQSEARTRLVLDTAPDAFVATDRDGIIMTWNAAAERMFGWSAAEAIGKPMRGLIVPPELRERSDERRRELVAAEGPVETQVYDVTLERRDGSRFQGESTVSRVIVGDDVIISGFIRDVTERQRRQEEHEELLREQAARAEAERVADMVSGIQALVDAALQSPSLEEMLDDLVAGVQQVLGADAAAIFLADDDETLRLGASSCGTPPANVDPIPFGDGFAGGVAGSRKPLFVKRPDPTALRDPGLRALEIDSLLAVPMLAQGAVIGVLEVCASPPHRFTADDLGMLRLAADRVALAISHARVYEREHNIAVTLQRSLLPERLPELPGLEVAARYRPAAAEAEVGGDWYDVIPIPGGGAGLVMGDVAGKGIGAASMVGRLRSALRAYALEGHGPAKVVEQLNRLVWTEAWDGQMVTLLYVMVDPVDGTARWVNAGHLPPLLVGANGRPRFLEGGSSVPLGVVPFPAYEEASAAIRPGSTLVLYTDGLVEVPGAHIDDGLSRLVEQVRSAPGDPEALCEHLLGTLVPERGAPDDVALLSLRNVPMSDRFRVGLPTTPEALASMRALLRRWLRHVGAGEQDVAEITTACGEAATNAIEHAGVGGGKPFEVSGRIRGRRVLITVRDLGAWRTQRQGDHGRGLSLMHALMDRVEVTPTDEGTTVRMERTLTRNGIPG